MNLGELRELVHGLSRDWNDHTEIYLASAQSWVPFGDARIVGVYVPAEPGERLVLVYGEPEVST